MQFEKPQIPAELQDSLGYNLYRVSLLFRRELIRALSEYGLTPEQWQVLVVLWSSDHPVSQSELAASVLKDKHTLSRIVSRLQRDGWIRKKISGADKRAVLITPSAKLRKQYAELSERLKSHYRTLLRNFDPEASTDLMHHLSQLRSLLEDTEQVVDE
jgi:DNA-binding MarR family transcriptional regulator